MSELIIPEILPADGRDGNSSLPPENEQTKIPQDAIEEREGAYFVVTEKTVHLNLPALAQKYAQDAGVCWDEQSQQLRQYSEDTGIWEVKNSHQAVREINELVKVLARERDIPLIPKHKFLGWKDFNLDGAWQMKLSDHSDGKNQLLQISSRRWRYITRLIDGNYPIKPHTLMYQQETPPKRPKCNLILHCGGREASLDEVKRVKTPRPTETWQPIPHLDLINEVQDTLAKTNLAAYKKADLDDIQAHDLVIRATDVGVCSNRLIPSVLHEWRKNTVRTVRRTGEEFYTSCGPNGPFWATVESGNAYAAFFSASWPTCV